jgi:DNA-binding Lrp family transcriptional regulator
MPTDRDILAALHERAPEAMPAADLAVRTGLPSDRILVRMKSLVSLGYVARVHQPVDVGYVLAAMGEREVHGDVLPITSLRRRPPRPAATTDLHHIA